MTTLLQAVSTPAELGTIANLEQHTLRNTHEPHFLDLYDARLASWNKAPLPPGIHPSLEYRGPPRLIVPTVRSITAPGETVAVRVLVLDSLAPRKVTLQWRPLGEKRFRAVAARHLGRAVYEAELPPAKDQTLEYRVEALTAGGESLVWPPGSPQSNQTLVPLPQQAGGGVKGGH